jgi:hypothetical protein
MALISTQTLPLVLKQPPLPRRPPHNAPLEALQAHVVMMHDYAVQQQQMLQDMYNKYHRLLEGFNLVGLAADLPTAGFPGRTFMAIDTKVLYRDTGTVWLSVGLT